MKALLIVDVQNDFLPGGALGVPDGDTIVPVINRIQEALHFDLIAATQDWHPPGHLSFSSSHKGREPGDRIMLDGLEQVLWPDHCVQGSRGAELARELQTEKIDAVFRKGTDPRLDSYSAFFDNAHRKSTGLDIYLRERQIAEIYLAGLATDYCVKYSALDGAKCGFKVSVFEDAVRGIELTAGDIERAWAEMKRCGVRRLRRDAGNEY